MVIRVLLTHVKMDRVSQHQAMQEQHVELLLVRVTWQTCVTVPRHHVQTTKHRQRSCVEPRRVHVTQLNNATAPPMPVRSTARPRLALCVVLLLALVMNQRRVMDRQTLVLLMLKNHLEPLVVLLLVFAIVKNNVMEIQQHVLLMLDNHLRLFVEQVQIYVMHQKHVLEM